MADENIKSWSSDPDANTPVGTAAIGTTLDDQLRAIKAIVRQESLDKQWIRPGYQVQKIDDTHFRMYGDLGGSEGSEKLLQKNRKVQLLVGTTTMATGTISAQESETISGVVWTKCTFAPDVYAGAVPDGLTEVKVGALVSINGALPGNVLTSSSTPLYGNAVKDSASGTTFSYSVTLNNFVGSLSSGQVFYITFPVANEGSALLKVNNSGYCEIKKIAGFASLNTPIPTAALQGLDGGDLATNQTAVLIYTVLNGQGIFNLVSPPAMAVTVGDLAKTLFKADISSYDATTCSSGGYVKLMKNLALVWCKTVAIPANSNKDIYLPLYQGGGLGYIDQVYAVTVTKVKSAGYSTAAFTVTTQSTGVVNVKNPDTVASEEAFIIAVVKLGYS